MNLAFNLIVITLSIVLTTSTNIIDSICHGSLQLHQNKILDIKTSVGLGAKLLLGTKTESYQDCLHKCCNSSSCDLTLYRKFGVSKLNHNCYLVQCGEYDNCQFTYHNNFISIFFEKADYLGNDDIGPSHNNDDDYKDHNGREHITDDSTPPTDAVPTSSTPSDTVPTSGTPSDTVPTSGTPSDTVPTSGTAPTDTVPTSGTAPTDTVPTSSTPSTDNSSSTDAPSITVLHPSPAVHNKTIPKVTKVIPKATNIVPDSIHHNSNDPENNDDNLTNNPCQPNGCNKDATVIVICTAVAVVFITVVIVTALAVRKLYDNRRKQHYHNVDYLINGMYS